MRTNCEIYIVGVCRSGLHALAAWIIPQIASTVAYFVGVLNGHAFSYPTEFYSSGKLIEKTELYENQDVERIIYDIQDVCKPSTLEGFIQDRRSNISSKRKTILFLMRNPLNNIASRMEYSIKYLYFTKKVNQIAIDYWIECAKEYLGETDILAKLKESGRIDDYVFVFYDTWFQDEEYRKEISDKLGLSFNDNGLNTVRHEGFGSSFDFQNYDNNAQKMDVLNRWKKYEGDTEFISLFRENPQIVEYYSKIYKEEFPLKF